MVGGLEHFLFVHIFGIIHDTDSYIFQRGRYITNQICFLLSISYMYIYIPSISYMYMYTYTTMYIYIYPTIYIDKYDLSNLSILAARSPLGPRILRSSTAPSTTPRRRRRRRGRRWRGQPAGDGMGRWDVEKIWEICWKTYEEISVNH